MSLCKPLPQTVANLELQLTTQKEVLKVFPDATIHYYNGFQSKTVNKNYTHYDFERNFYSVYFMPYSVVEFDFNGVKQVVKIRSRPHKSRILYKSYQCQDKKDVIRFSRIALNMKTHDFNSNGNILQDIKIEIVKFITANPSLSINDRHLDPRLKKLIAFV